ncbi:MAG: LytTR family transcriptional regulator [Candidatus Kapaibacterium sp.]|nr:MAG: LytTR family transcriptional regulator [Candidatus Kapabacteria bacterium]
MLHTTKDAKPRLLFHALAEIEERLRNDHRFTRCSRSTILNLHHCKGWKHAQKDALVLCEIAGKEQEYSISRTYKAAFVRAWTEFVQRR